jgi:Fe-S oxidoreductase
VNSIYHVLTKYGVPEESKTDLPATFDIHDSCPARHYSDLHDSARNIIEQVGHNVHELESSRGASRCCGFGGMIHAVDGELSSKVAERRLSESEFDMVAYCAGCRARFASLGKPTLHMLDLAFNPNWKEQKGMPPTSSLSNYWKRWRLKCRLKKL